MQKAINPFRVLFHGGVKRRAQPHKLAVEYFLISAFLEFTFIEPAARAAQSGGLIHMAAVVDEADIIDPVISEKTLHFGNGLPPEVVVAFDEQLFHPANGLKK